MAQIHPTAIVDASAKLASSVVIGPWCTVGPRVEIGEDTVLRPHVHITALTRIGKANTFHPYCVVGGDPQDLKWHGEPTWLEMGDYNTVREHATIHRGTGNGGGMTQIGSHNLLMCNVHIAHDCVIGNHTILANNVMLAGHIHIEDYANLGGGAGVHHFARIGYCAFVGAMSRVAKDVPPFMLCEGSPAAIRGFNQVGMSRLGYDEKEVEAVKDAFKRIFRTKGGSAASEMKGLRAAHPKSQALARIMAALQQISGGVNGRALETARTDDKRAARSGAGNRAGTSHDPVLPS